LKHALFIVSLLDGKGPTGVEKHFNDMLHQARCHEIDAELVAPYPRRGIARKGAAMAARMIATIDRERAAIFDAWVEAKTLERKLAGVLPRYAALGRTITLCAQDPLSALAALQFKATHDCRVVIVIHYNVSVAEEMFQKGETTVHGPLWNFAFRTERQALAGVDQIIFVSEFMRKLTLRRMPELESVSHTVIPNFIADSPASDPVTSFDADLISIGTLEPRKNHAFLLRVLARAAQLGHRYTLTLVGNGPEADRLQQQAAELGIKEQVNFAGFCRNAGNMIVRHRVLAHAARIENMPITLIEALAAGRPILAPAVGGITEIFDHGVEGYHWPLQDVDTAAALLIELLGRPDIYDRFSQAALVRYRSKFGGDLLVSHWLTTILNSHGSNHTGWQKTWRPMPALDRGPVAQT
jgi:glycosyltransferase involved in cell wall biosynthesis